MWCIRYGKDKGIHVTKEVCFAWQIRHGCSRRCEYRLPRREVMKMRKVLTTKQQVLALLEPVGGVLQEVAVLNKVDIDALADRCGEVIAIALEIAVANGVDKRRLIGAVKKSRRVFKNGLQNADIKSKNGGKM